MKHTTFLAAAVLFFTAANAQVDTTKTTPVTPVTAPLPASPVTPSIPVTIPEHLIGVSSGNIRPEHYLPVLGSYQPTGSSKAQLNITVDESNIGIVWIEGLSQGRVKAILKKSPSTYKIPAQKTAEGKSVPEGTLYFNPETKELSIHLGKAFNDADPAAIFSSENNTKAKGWSYRGSKSDNAVPTETPVSQQ
jgi:hypothetical protein